MPENNALVYAGLAGIGLLGVLLLKKSATGAGVAGGITGFAVTKNRGETITYSYIIRNTGNTALSLTTSADLTHVVTSEKIVLQASTAVSLTTTAPNNVKTISGTVTVPATASAGFYNALASVSGDATASASIPNAIEVFVPAPTATIESFTVS